MAGTNYVVLYDSANIVGDVIGMWLRASSDNLATYTVDGFLQVDGVTVALGLDTAQCVAVSVADPTAACLTAERRVVEVTFNGPVGAVDDVVERASGDRDPDPLYEYAS